MKEINELNRYSDAWFKVAFKVPFKECDAADWAKAAAREIVQAYQLGIRDCLVIAYCIERAAVEHGVG